MLPLEAPVIFEGCKKHNIREGTLPGVCETISHDTGQKGAAAEEEDSERKKKQTTTIIQL